LANLPIVSEPRGEYVLALASSPNAGDRENTEIDPRFLTQLVDALVSAAGIDEGAANKLVAKGLSLSERAVAKLVKKYRISVKQQNRPTMDPAELGQP
jgi:hypothetical protein